MSSPDTTIVQTRPALTRAGNFFDFWKQTRLELADVAPSVEVQRGETITDGLLLDTLRYGSLGGSRINGFLLHWDDDRPRPLVVYTHGYKSQTRVVQSWAERGLHVLGFDTRGFGRSKGAVDHLSEAGYVLTGIGSPETSILRGAVCDYVRAWQVGRHCLGSRIGRTIFYGRSFAGALALMAAVLATDAPDLLAIGVPTFGWAEGRRRLVREGSGREINEFLRANPTQAAAVMKILSYFDPMNFADQVHCPALVGVGLEDQTVPPETVYAIVNHLNCPHEVREFPVSHSDKPEEQLWAQFDAEWLALAIQGVSPGFGDQGPHNNPAPDMRQRSSSNLRHPPT
jgi:cephalosporin-C deacetylase